VSVSATKPAADPADALAPALTAWHAGHGRHDLPWQQVRTPYRVWVSEIMLQQTQVATVIGYYLRFMQRFPDVQALAAAPLDEVLHLWSGLGYYSRARNLHRAAQRIVAECAGQLPGDSAQLSALPGIGRSTAAAILALSTGAAHAILDGNVRRVLARYFGVEGPPNQRSVETELWALAERCTPATDVATYTQAIMDLGATVCTRRRPLCLHCPLSAACLARIQGRQLELPGRRARAARRRKQVVMLLAQREDGDVLLRRRPEAGLWGGLWVLPEFADVEAARSWCQRHFAQAQFGAVPLPSIEHAFTHFDLTITPWPVCCRGAGVMEAPDLLWYNTRAPVRVGVPAPIATLLASLPAMPQEER
jgi:A/G-specific adenine glycosylase